MTFWKWRGLDMGEVSEEGEVFGGELESPEGGGDPADVEDGDIRGRRDAASELGDP
jgi:hypothetical protein